MVTFLIVKAPQAKKIVMFKFLMCCGRLFLNYPLFISAPQTNFFLAYVWFCYNRAKFEELCNIERGPQN